MSGSMTDNKMMKSTTETDAKKPVVMSFQYFPKEDPDVFVIFDSKRPRDTTEDAQREVISFYTVPNDGKSPAETAAEGRQIAMEEAERAKKDGIENAESLVTFTAPIKTEDEKVQLQPNHYIEKHFLILSYDTADNLIKDVEDFLKNVLGAPSRILTKPLSINARRFDIKAIYSKLLEIGQHGLLRITAVRDQNNKDFQWIFLALLEEEPQIITDQTAINAII